MLAAYCSEMLRRHRDTWPRAARAQGRASQGRPLPSVALSNSWRKWFGAEVDDSYQNRQVRSGLIRDFARHDRPSSIFVVTSTGIE
jgi:hypothetical protein